MNEEIEPISMDVLFSREVNTKEAEEVLARSLPPVGNYHTSPDENPITASFKEFVDEGTGVSRRMVTLTGRVTATIKGDEYTAGMRVRLSPDSRKSREYVDGEPTGEMSTKDDSATKRWAEAVKLYKGTMGENPKKESDLISFLTQAPFQVYLYHMNGEIGFSGISALRGRR